MGGHAPAAARHAPDFQPAAQKRHRAKGDGFGTGRAAQDRIVGPGAEGDSQRRRFGNDAKRRQRLVAGGVDPPALDSAGDLEEEARQTRQGIGA